MEAGYDYTLLGTQSRRRPWAAPALFLAVLAVALLTAGGAYYGYAAQAQADETPPAQLAETAANPDAAARLTDDAVSVPADRPARLQTSAIANQQLYPGGRAQVDSWVNPMAYEPEQRQPATSFRWWAGSGSR